MGLMILLITAALIFALFVSLDAAGLGKAAGDRGVQDRGVQDRGVQDRRNIAATYISSLSDTQANREAIERLEKGTVDHDKYTVFPDCCTGPSDAFVLTPEALRVHLIEELDETHVPGDEATDEAATLEELFGDGDADVDRVRFDVTRPGCLQSTLIVFPGDCVDHVCDSAG